MISMKEVERKFLNYVSYYTGVIHVWVWLFLAIEKQGCELIYSDCLVDLVKIMFSGVIILPTADSWDGLLFWQECRTCAGDYYSCH